MSVIINDYHDTRSLCLYFNISAKQCQTFNNVFDNLIKFVILNKDMQKNIFPKEKIAIMPSTPDGVVVKNVTKKHNKLVVDDKYKYQKNWFVRSFQFIFYHFIAKPVFFLYGKIGLGIKVHGKKKLKNIKGGAITVSNHVHCVDFMIAAAFVKRFRRSHIVSQKQNFDVPYVGKLMTAFGVMPLPDTVKASMNFYSQITTYLKKNRFVHIFPEGSMWPYYNKLRPLKSGAFHFASKNNVPVIPYVIVFRQTKGLRRIVKKRPKLGVYICDPIYPDLTKGIRERNEELRDRTQEAMQKVLDEHPSYEYYHYITREEYETMKKSPQ